MLRSGTGLSGAIGGDAMPKPEGVDVGFSFQSAMG
jgi:hypothetical protein